MGYDMRIVGTPDGEEGERIAAARKRFDAAVEVRQQAAEAAKAAGREVWTDPAVAKAQEAVSAAYTEMSEADRSYFRLNIGGMGRFVGIMDEFGMLKDGHPGEWPERPEGLTSEQVWACDPDDEDDDEYADVLAAMTPEQLQIGRDYHAEVERHLRLHDADTPGIAVHKLYSTNDGWLVTPGEIKYALKAYDEYDAAKRDEILAEALGAGSDNRAYWDQWIDYLRRAEHREGFRVR